MEAKTQSINEVFSNATLLQVPYYQRQYVWREEPYRNWSRFCADMESTMMRMKCYFLGALILKHDELTQSDRFDGISKKMVIVDGQQRLTTLSIYMKLLHLITGRNQEFSFYYQLSNCKKDPIIRHNCVDKEAYEKIIKLETAVPSIGLEGNIADAYVYFYKRFEELKEQGCDFERLLNAIKANAKFVVIELGQEDEEQQIFDTINSLGVDLTTDELLKNYLYEIKDEQAYMNTWHKMFDTAEAKRFWGTDAASIKASKSRDGKTIDRMLYAYVRIKMWEFKLTNEQKKEFVKTENVYSTCQAFCEQFGVAKQNIANEIIEYAKLFKQYLDASILEKRIPQYACIQRIACFMHATRTYSLMPYLLYVLRNVSSETERNSIFGYLENYLLRRQICSTSNKSYSDLFSENLIGQRVLTAKALKSYISSKPLSSNLAMPIDADLCSCIKKSAHDEESARIILYMHETKLAPALTSTFNGGWHRYYAEQLMPRPCAAADSNWPTLMPDVDAERERIDAAKTLGNWFLLDDVEEKSLKKSHCEALAIKKQTMLKWAEPVRSSYAMLKKLQSWEMKHIYDRAAELGGYINKSTWTAC